MSKTSKSTKEKERIRNIKMSCLSKAFLFLEVRSPNYEYLIDIPGPLCNKYTTVITKFTQLYLLLDSFNKKDIELKHGLLHRVIAEAEKEVNQTLKLKNPDTIKVVLIYTYLIKLQRELDSMSSDNVVENFILNIYIFRIGVITQMINADDKNFVLSEESILLNFLFDHLDVLITGGVFSLGSESNFKPTNLENHYWLLDYTLELCDQAKLKQLPLSKDLQKILIPPDSTNIYLVCNKRHI